MLVCDSIDSRDKLKKLGQEGNVELKAVIGKKHNITIVGMKNLYTKEEVVTQLVTQNSFLSQLCTVNDINEHLTIHSVKPTKSNENVFQAFASVSSSLKCS